mmetsp:Transcript_12381/g.49661  ORF Transcript_12381/g.49661 Transcript_12381/m.49661 type:complete len:121 (+) Transcript_12381:312-674(+)
MLWLSFGKEKFLRCEPFSKKLCMLPLRTRQKSTHVKRIIGMFPNIQLRRSPHPKRKMVSEEEKTMARLSARPMRFSALTVTMKMMMTVQIHNTTKTKTGKILSWHNLKKLPALKANGSAH